VYSDKGLETYFLIHITHDMSEKVTWTLNQLYIRVINKLNISLYQNLLTADVELKFAPIEPLLSIFGDFILPDIGSDGKRCAVIKIGFIEPIMRKLHYLAIDKVVFQCASIMYGCRLLHGIPPVLSEPIENTREIRWKLHGMNERAKLVVRYEKISQDEEVIARRICKVLEESGMEIEAYIQDTKCPCCNERI
jgi:hypothetical protein